MIKGMIWFALGATASICLAAVVTVGPKSFLALSFFGSRDGINLLGIAAIAGFLAALPFGAGLRVFRTYHAPTRAAALGVATGASIFGFLWLLARLPPERVSSFWSIFAIAVFVASSGFLLGRYASRPASPKDSHEHG